MIAGDANSFHKIYAIHYYGKFIFCFSQCWSQKAATFTCADSLGIHIEASKNFAFVFP